MKKEVSVYLDASRLGAALLVFIGHANGLFGNVFGKLGLHASEAVAVFFVLSGFVIAYVSARRELTPASYAAARATRIYSVAVPVVVACMTLDLFGRVLFPSSYTAQVFASIYRTALQFASATLYFGEWWGLHIYPGTDEPYWSLGYEVWYYVAFGIAMFGTTRFRWAAVTAVLLLVGPRVAIYFPLWLLGVATYRLMTGSMLRRLSPGRAETLGVFCFAIAVATLGIMKVAVPLTGTMYEPIAPGTAGFWNWLYFHLTGSAFALTIVGVDLCARRLRGVVSVIGKPVRWMAGATFTLYLAHLPIMIFLTAAASGLPAITRTWTVITATLAASLLLAELGERRKAWWGEFGRQLLQSPLARRARHRVATYLLGTRMGEDRDTVQRPAYSFRLRK